MKILILFGFIIETSLTAWGAQQIESADFTWREEGVDHKVKIWWDGRDLRVDTPFHQFSLIYDTLTEEYLGLETRDAKYWHFNWIKLKSAIETSRQHTTDLSKPLVVESSEAPPTSPAPTYAWRKTDSLKTIGDWKCQLWETTDEFKRRVRLWCTLQAGPSRELWHHYIAAGDTIKLVAVRSIGPSLSPAALAALPVTAGTPVELTLGDEETSSRLTLQAIRLIDPDPTLFQPPPRYELNPLSAVEGVE